DRAGSRGDPAALLEFERGLEEARPDAAPREHLTDDSQASLLRDSARRGRQRERGVEPGQDAVVLLARVGVREVVDLAVDERGAGAPELVARQPRERDGKRPVERPVREVDAAPARALQAASP